MRILAQGTPPPYELRGTCDCGCVVECWKREALSCYDPETDGSVYRLDCPTCDRGIRLGEV